MQCFVFPSVKDTLFMLKSWVLGSTGDSVSSVLGWLHIGFGIGILHRSAHTSHIQVRAGTLVSTHISHTGQDWLSVGTQHSHLTNRSVLVHQSSHGSYNSHSGQGWYIDRHTDHTSHMVRSGTSVGTRLTHLTFRSGLVHRLSHGSHISHSLVWYICWRTSHRSGLVHRSAHISHTGQGWYTTHTSHIQVRAGTSVAHGTHISHTSQGWYINRHMIHTSHLHVRAGTSVGTWHTSHIQVRAGTSVTIRHTHLTYRSGLMQWTKKDHSPKSLGFTLL